MIIPAKPMKLRFSLRAILVAMTLLALWCAYSMNWIRQRRELIESGVVHVHMTSHGSYKPAPGWLGLFGEQGYLQLSVDLAENSPEFARIQAIFPEAEVEQFYTPTLEW